MCMVSTVEIIPSVWVGNTDEHYQKIREFYETSDNKLDEQFKLMNVRWSVQTPPNNKRLLKTTKQDKDDDYVRQTK